MTLYELLKWLTIYSPHLLQTLWFGTPLMKLTPAQTGVARRKQVPYIQPSQTASMNKK